jgi:Pentapeptide repeats (8 copies)
VNLAAVPLAADCSRCVGLCCVAPAFVASADFAFSKPAGVACRHLGADARCSIHDRLRPAGMPGCAAYDCFGAGQRVVALLGAAGRSPRMLRAYEVVRQLHELLWYLTDALSRPAAAPVHAALTRAAAAIDAAVDADAAESADPAAQRATVAPLLRRASTLVRAPAGPDRRGADLGGRELMGLDLGRADLSTAQLIGADLRGADLRYADLLGADLRGADLGGADLTGALYLTRTQVGGARGSPGTQLPDRLPHPAHWS